MGKKYAPLALGLIEEGRLAKSLDDEIARGARHLVQHVREYGRDATKKSKVEVTLKVTISPVGDENGYVVAGAISTKTPGRPLHTTMAVHEQEQTGEDVLFVRKTGSSSDDPRQMRLATDDGRGVHPQTGEILPPMTDRKKKEAE